MTEQTDVRYSFAYRQLRDRGFASQPLPSHGLDEGDVADYTTLREAGERIWAILAEIEPVAARAVPKLKRVVDQALTLEEEEAIGRRTGADGMRELFRDIACHANAIAGEFEAVEFFRPAWMEESVG